MTDDSMPTQGRGDGLAARASSWDPTQYARFDSPRLRPALDLLSHVPLAQPKTIADLGCGPGNVTQLIAQRWPGAEVVGVDNSTQMLDRARSTAARPNLSWLESDIQSWSARGEFDLVFSNATLQWLGDHQTLFPRLLRAVAAGGCLAIQVPDSHHSDSHRLMRETVLALDNAQQRYPQLIAELCRPKVLSADAYYDLLVRESKSLDIWYCEYLQVLDGADAVLEWTKGTALRPVLQGLNDDDRELFLHDYRARLDAAYPRRDDGRTLYPFRRLFIVAQR